MLVILESGNSPHRRVNYDHLIVVQVDLHYFQGGNPGWERRDRVVGEVQDVQLAQATECEGEG